MTSFHLNAPFFTQNVSWTRSDDPTDTKTKGERLANTQWMVRDSLKNWASISLPTVNDVDNFDSANCRRRHVKCPENRPSCSACIRIKQTCSYLTDGAGSEQGSRILASSTQRGEDDAEREIRVDSYPEMPSASPVAMTSEPSESTMMDTVDSQAREQTQPAHSSLGTICSLADDVNSSMTGDASNADTRAACLKASNRVAGISKATTESSMAFMDQESSRPALGSVRFDTDPVDSRLMPPQTYAAAHTPTEAWTVGSVSSAGNIDSDTAGWFGLLFEDAVLGNSDLPLIDFETDGRDIFGNSISNTPIQSLSQSSARPTKELLSTGPRAESSNTSLLERLPRLGRDQVYEKESWHSSEPISLQPQEQFLFQYFVRNVSQWVSCAIRR